ncbi:MAG: PEP-CTERM sorting domain-containing protein [Terriglobia bacterium]
MSKWTKLLLIATCVAILPALLPASSSADTLSYSNGITRTSQNSQSTKTPGIAGPGVFYSDLGSPVNYQCCTGWTVSGTGTVGTSFTAANLFTAAISGNVTQIDLGVGWVVGPDPFVASIWTDVGNLPGSQIGPSFGGLLANAEFGLSTNSLVTVPVSGVSLTAGQSYFMILAPTSVNDSSWNAWNWNAQGVNGLDLYSTDGGMSWNSNGTGNPLGAFDVLGGGTQTPEPGTLVLLGTGLLGLGGIVRRRLTARR